MHLGHMTNHHYISSCIGVYSQLVLGQHTGNMIGIGHMAHPWEDTPLGRHLPSGRHPLSRHLSGADNPLGRPFLDAEKLHFYYKKHF